jgi:hypothetical protein
METARKVPLPYHEGDSPSPDLLTHDTNLLGFATDLLGEALDFLGIANKTTSLLYDNALSVVLQLK